jgi:hypothetical protein
VRLRSTSSGDENSAENHFSTSSTEPPGKIGSWDPDGKISLFDERLSDGGIKLSRTRYIGRLLERFGMTGCNGVRPPMKKDLQSSEDDSAY